MTDEQPVNLRLARKRKIRAEKDAQAQRNRTVFGRSKTEALAASAAIERARDRLDAHKREKPE